MTQSIRDAAQALLSCPHCDSEALIIPAQFDGATGEWFRVWCKGCGASQMPRYAEPGFAAAAWNLRATVAAAQPTADERLERLLSDVEMYGHAHAVETRNDAFRGHESMAGRPQYDLPAMFAEIEQSARALLSASQEDAEHAAMYRWLRDNKCNSMHLTRNGDHACNYMTASQWIDENPDWFDGTSKEELEKMKETNTIWDLQIYPNTPVGFNVWRAATLDAAIRAAMSVKETK